MAVAYEPGSGGEMEQGLAVRAARPINGRVALCWSWFSGMQMKSKALKHAESSWGFRLAKSGEVGGSLRQC